MSRILTAAEVAALKARADAATAGPWTWEVEHSDDGTINANILPDGVVAWRCDEVDRDAEADDGAACADAAFIAAARADVPALASSHEALRAALFACADALAQPVIDRRLQEHTAPEPWSIVMQALDRARACGWRAPGDAP